MPTIQVKNVPEETHRVLRRRAAEANQSLQEYLLTRLVEQAEEMTLDEVLDRIGHRSGGHITFEEAASALRHDRDRR